MKKPEKPIKKIPPPPIIAYQVFPPRTAENPQPESYFICPACLGATPDTDIRTLTLSRKAEQFIWLREQGHKYVNPNCTRCGKAILEETPHE